MFLTDYDREKVMKQARAEGYAEGRLEALISLVKDNILSVKDAAEYAGITEAAFEEKMMVTE